MANYVCMFPFALFCFDFVTNFLNFFTLSDQSCILGKLRKSKSSTIDLFRFLGGGVVLRDRLGNLIQLFGALNELMFNV